MACCKFRCWQTTRCWYPRFQPECAHGLGNVLDRLVAEILPGKCRKLVPDLLMDVSGDADPTGFGQTLQPVGDVDTIADQVFALDDHVTKVDADPELHPAVLNSAGS